MSAKKENKRTSILKRRQSSGEQDEEATTGFNTKRKLMFSAKNEVLEFAQCEDRLTIWGNKYETSVARSEGSSDSGGTSTSRCVSTDFHSMQVSHTTTSTTISIYDADKENRQIIESEANFTVAESFPMDHSTAVNASKIPEMSILNSSEVPRADLRGNMTFDEFRVQEAEIRRNREAEKGMAKPAEDSIIMKKKIASSPRRGKILHDNHKSNPVKATTSEERFSISLEEDEKSKANIARQTIDMNFEEGRKSNANDFRMTMHQTVDMNLEDETRKTMNKTVDMNISLVQKPSLTHFKCPEIPRDTKSRQVARSPPIKPEHTINRQELNEIYENLAENTPSKNNLCCLTPQRSASKAQAMSKIKKSSLNFSIVEPLAMEESGHSYPSDALPSMIDDRAQSRFNFGDSVLESTDELNKQAERLIKNPNATLRTLSRPSLPGSQNSTHSSLDISIDMSKPFGKARSTEYGPQDMSVNPPFQIFHDSMDEKPRETVYNQEMSLNDGNAARKSLNKQFDDDMHETLINEPRNTIRDSIMVHKAHINRETTNDPKGMDESTSEKFSDVKFENKNRGTIFDNAMEESMSEKLRLPKNEPKVSIKPIAINRATTFQQNEMDMSAFGDEKVQAQAQNENFLSKPRATTFQQDEMDVSSHWSSKSAKSEVKTRVTTFQQDEMELSTSQDQAMKPLSFFKQTNVGECLSFMSKPRATTYQNNEMDMSAHDDQQQSQNENVINKPRATTFQPIDMDESRSATPIMPKSSHIPMKNRPTTFQQNEMDFSTREMKESQVNENYINKPRATTFQQNELAMSQSIPKPRATTFEQNEMETSARVEENFPQSFKNRPTTFQNAMEMSRAEPSYCEQSILRESQQNYGQNNIHRVSIFGAVNETIKSETIDQPESQQVNESLDKTLTNEVEMSMKFPGRQTVYDDQQMEEDSANKKDKIISRPTIFDQIEMNKSRGNYRPTIFNQNEMELSQAAPRLTIHQENEMELSGINEISRDKIFTPPSGFKSENENRAGPSRRKNSEDSVKWHNLTDAEMLGDDMLEDVSNPIEFSTEQQASKRQKLTLNGISRFEDAMDDFVNLTINSSPLNVSGDFGSFTLKGYAKKDSKRMSCPLLPDRDYESMLDGLIDTLKEKNVPKPRLAIDDYLEKLQIAPVKIERRLDLEAAAVMERINAKKEEIRLRREGRKKIEHERNLMLPEIPDAAFLMRNYLDSMTDIIRERIMLEAVIRPIFPESVNFVNLLKNKFETDPYLAENWKLDTTFWFMKNFKITHKKLVFYTISINSQQSPAEADDSTMPILFSQAMLILGSKFRYTFKFSRKWQMLRKEFKNAVNGVDNFNSMCRSTNDLMTFLNFYHERVMKACEIVENFNQIVLKYGAVCVRDEKSNLLIVKKMHFLRPNEVGLVEILSLCITVSTHINDISINDVSVKGKLFEYELNPTQNLKTMTGLMLLEFILYDVEKFVEGNYNALKINF